MRFGDTIHVEFIRQTMNLSCSDLNHGKYVVLIQFKMIINRFSVSFPSMRFMFRGLVRIFQRGGHTASHPGYLPDCLV